MMLLRIFLAWTDPNMKVILFDQDKEIGLDRSEGLAGDLLEAHRFDYNSEVMTFVIHPDHVVILFKRRK